MNMLPRASQPFDRDDDEVIQVEEEKGGRGGGGAGFQVFPSDSGVQMCRGEGEHPAPPPPLPPFSSSS